MSGKAIGAHRPPRSPDGRSLTIHACCESQETAAALRLAAQDRRLAGANLSVRMGGVAAALARSAHQATVDVIVVESSLQGEALLASVGELSGVSAARGRIIVIGHVNDILIYRELRRRHVCDYLVAPVSPRDLIDSIGALCADVPGPTRGRSIAFIGARGGAGSSAICHNAGWALASGLKAETVIADFDLPFGTTELDFNQKPAPGLAEALDAGNLDERRLERLLSRCADHLSLLTSPAVPDRDGDMNAEAAERIVALLRRSRAYVILDLPRHWSAAVRRLLFTADDVVITAEPDLASLRNTKNLVDLLVSRRPADPPPRLVLNKINTAGRPEIGVEEFAAAAGALPSALFSFDARLFGVAANNGLMIAEAARKSEAAGSFQTLAEILAGRDAPKSEASGLLGQILSRLRLTRTPPLRAPQARTAPL